MKILVLSDSHRAVGLMRTVVRKEKPDMIIHLGDLITDAEKLAEDFPHIPMERVKGNCDEGMYPAEKLFTVEGKKIFICHGDGFGVNSGLLSLEMAAKEKGADIALYGHTHIPLYDFDGTLHIMNPGPCGGRHFLPGQKDSYGLIFIEKGEIFIRLMNIEED